jgi:hypothetical protein
MAYCRFSDGDVYLFDHVGGFVECCAYRLAKKVSTIFTTGTKGGMLLEKLFGVVGPCKECGGKGCDKCMMCGSMEFKTYEEALKHLEAHRAAGHQVPDYAIEDIKKCIERGEKPTKYVEEGEDEGRTS